MWHLLLFPAAMVTRTRFNVTLYVHCLSWSCLKTLCYFVDVRGHEWDLTLLTLKNAIGDSVCCVRNTHFLLWLINNLTEAMRQRPTTLSEACESLKHLPESISSGCSFTSIAFSLVCSSRVWMNKNSVVDIAIRATSSLVLEANYMFLWHL